MQLRRFLGDNTPAALNAVREALGDDAIILANRRVGERVEIIATGQIDDEAIAVASAMEAGTAPAAMDPLAGDDGIHVELSDAAMARSESAGNDAANAARGTATTDSTGRHPAFRDVDALSRPVAAEEPGQGPVRFETRAESRQNPASLHTGQSARASEIPGTLNAEAENAERAQLAQTTESAQTPEPDQTIECAETTDSVEAPEPAESGRSAEIAETAEAVQASAEATVPTASQEMQAVHELLGQHLEVHKALLEKRFQQQDTKLWGELDPVRSTNFKRLLRLGLGAGLAAELVAAVPGELDIDAATRRALSLLKARLPIGIDSTFTEPGITVLSGPAGGGKSTALMKLAAEHVRCHDRQSLVMVCADNRRIGAFESLQACARLLGVPAVQARNTEELADRIDALSHKALVLVDHTLASEPESLAIPTGVASESGGRALRRLLVLPATLQAATAESILSHEANAADHCVLTQLDKSARLGEVLNALIRHQLPVAWWSDNAHIQHPMQRAEASVLVATAVAMGRRVSTTDDDDLLMRLVQPRRDLAGTRIGVPSAAPSSASTAAPGVAPTAASSAASTAAPSAAPTAAPIAASIEAVDAGTVSVLPNDDTTKIARPAANKDDPGADTGADARSLEHSGFTLPSVTFRNELADIVETISKRPVERLVERPVVASRIRSGRSTGRRKVGRDLT